MYLLEYISLQIYTSNMKTQTITKTESKLALLLIREELKSRKLATILLELGVKNCQLLPSLNEPIAEYLGLDTDEAFLEYDRLVDECTKEIDDSNVAAIAKQLVCRLP